MDNYQQAPPTPEELQWQAASQNEQLRAFCNNTLYQLYKHPQMPSVLDYYEGKKNRGSFHPTWTKRSQVDWENKVYPWDKLLAKVSNRARTRLEERRKAADAEYARIHADEENVNEFNRQFFLREQERQNKHCDELIAKAKNHYEEPTQNCFAEILKLDQYYVNPNSIFPVDCSVISYDRSKGEFAMKYRVPCWEEFSNVKEYKYVKKGNFIDTKYLSSKDEAKRDMDVLKQLLLRVASIVFEVDKFGYINRVRMTGYISFSDAYGRLETRDVVRVVMSKHEVLQDFSVDAIERIEKLFALMAKQKRFLVSSNLYQVPAAQTMSLEESCVI